MRLIDADKIPYVDLSDGKKVCIVAFAEKINQMPTIEPESHWIPCSERLPEEGERVLATHLGGLNPERQVIEHIYQNGEFTCGWDMDTDFHSPTFGQRYMGKVIAGTGTKPRTKMIFVLGLSGRRKIHDR